MSRDPENDYIIDKFIEIFTDCVKKMNTYLFEDMPKVTLGKASIRYPSSDNIDYYLSKSGTCQSIIRIPYSVTDNKGNKVDQEPLQFMLPMLIKGIFVFDGKTKLPLNRVINDYECVINESKIYLDSDIYISKNSGLNVRIADSNKFEVADYDSMDSSRFMISDYSVKKLSILFDFNVNNPLDKTSVDRIVNEMKTRKNLRDNVLNKRIQNSTSALIQVLQTSKYDIIFEMKNKFIQRSSGKKLSGYKLYPTTIKNIINDFFKGNDKYFTGIQNPTNVNPLVFHSMKSKVIFENQSSKTNKLVKYAKYDLSFYGIVDPIMTPDNLNTSRVNELVKGVRIVKGEIAIQCYDPDFNLVELKFIDYVNSKILSSDSVDYDFKEVIESNEYSVKYRFNTVKSPTFDYIELHPDYRLSEATAQIPMINIADSVRVAMAAKMMTQAIQVKGSELPKVNAGNDKFEDNPLVTYYEGKPGIIEGVEEGIVTVRDVDGKLAEYTIPEAIKGIGGINISYDTNLKVGYGIKTGDILFKPSSFDEDMRLNIGVNARVAMMTYRGYNYEDGVVVSRSFAEKLSHTTVITLTIDIDSDLILEGLKDSEDVILQNGILMAGRRVIKYSSSSSDFRSDLGLNTKYSRPWNYRLPAGIDKALVFDVKVAPGTASAREETDYLLGGYGRGTQWDMKELFNQLGDIDPDELNLSRIPDFKANKDFAYTVKMKLVCTHDLKLGDKLTNRFGSKGVVSLIVDDKEMVRDEKGRVIDVIMNPHAVISRKNMSQSCEILLMKISSKLYQVNSELLKSKDFTSIRENFKKYRIPEFYKMTDEELIDFHNSGKGFYPYVTGAFTKISLPVIIEWMKELGVEEGETLIDGVTGKRIRNKILTGDMYLLKLYFLANNYAKVTEVRIPGLNKLTLGKGSITKGSKWGNMEMDTLLANNATKLIYANRHHDVTGAGWMYCHAILSGLIYKMKDELEEN